MNKTALALIITLLVSAVAGAFVIRLGKANPNPFFIVGSDAPPSIYIDSPTNKTYNGKVFLNFTVYASEQWNYNERVKKVEYSVDWKFGETFIVTGNLSEPFSYSTFLENLTDGNHTLIVLVACDGWSYNYNLNSESFLGTITLAVAYFTLDTASPAIQILSLENKTYYESDLELNFTVNEDFHIASCVLDGQNVQVDGNFTFSDLPFGSHNLTVYASDFAGNFGVSDTITFTIAETFPTLLVGAVAIAGVTTVGLGLSVYLKKRHRKMHS